MVVGHSRTTVRAWVRGAGALAATAALTAACAVQSAPAQPTHDGDATAFLSRYVTSDGRVVRPDQGGDTVSEGQAYALLIAATKGDEARFATVWTWTRTHLQRPDGLLAWHWSNGAVQDATPAADADVDTAVALLKAAARFHVSSYRRSGTLLARAVLAYESVRTPAGQVVVAGPWATASPATVNPSYLVAGTASYLAAATGDRRWNAVATATATLDSELADRYALPPDWATVAASPAGTGAAVTAVTSPDGATPPQYGLDAVRLVIRLATSCSSSDRHLAARYLTALGTPGEPGARSLTGSALVTWRNPATDIALWAAATAAGRTSVADAALQSARALARNTPTYYGRAWLALGPLLWETRTGVCS
jgi:endo-1,4-beta-D-glucanase Y